MSECEKTRRDKIRQDLRSIRRLNEYMDTAMKAREKYSRQLETLRGDHSRTAESMKMKIKRQIERLGIEAAMDELERLETVYLRAIDKMDPIDRTIITENLINGTPMEEVAKKIHYTRDGANKRMARIVEEIGENVR